MKIHSNSLILLTTLIFSSYLCAAPIQFESKIKRSYIQTMKSDLSALRQMKYTKPVSDGALSVLGLKRMSTNNMIKWLEDRVQVVIAQSEFKNIDVREISRSYIYPYNTKAERPILEIDKILSRLLEIQATTVMSNIGAAIYAQGKFNNILYGVKLKTIRVVKTHRVTSPRTGIIMIGDGHFMKKFDINKTNRNAHSNSINRLSTFFHEARHSDGHAKSLGFFHAKCPVGHDYENLNACDRNLNGPYTVGAIVTKEFTRSCGNKCSQESKDVLKMRYLDSLNRVIRKTIIGKNAEMLKKLIRLRDTYITIIKNNIYKGEELAKAKENLLKIKGYITQIKNSGSRSKQVKSIFWDARPEGSRS